MKSLSAKWLRFLVNILHYTYSFHEILLPKIANWMLYNLKSFTKLLFEVQTFSFKVLNHK